MQYDKIRNTEELRNQEAQFGNKYCKYCVVKSTYIVNEGLKMRQITLIHDCSFMYQENILPTFYKSNRNTSSNYTSRWFLLSLLLLVQNKLLFSLFTYEMWPWNIITASWRTTDQFHCYSCIDSCKIVKMEVVVGFTAKILVDFL